MTTDDKPIKKTDNLRERELFKAVFSTPNGKELLEIWTRKLTRVKTFLPEMSEAHCRHVGGRHSLMIDIIKTNSET
ncbi:hypothetical protein KAR91_12770 [Candidatus Pacearchaeota archaeon]|nr:hypothetical protein [Candidatus Pacearchaeota archaeon]